MTDSLLKKILIVRTDRIGDVVLSLPMIPVVQSRYPGAYIAFLVRSYTRDILAGQPGIQKILLYDNQGMLKPFQTALSELRAERFDAVVVTYPTLRLAWLMFLARIRVRVGTGYRWYSFLFNRKVYEHRKTAEKHEAEYNVSLLRALDCFVPEKPCPNLVLEESEVREAGLLLANLGLQPGNPFVVLHPGSGGSAREWSPESFGELAARLGSEGLKVIITGGPGEEMLVERVVASAGNGVLTLPRPVGLKTLAAFLRSASVFVSNSTGPLHIAAAVRTPVVAFYPPIPQCSARRWGPLTDAKVLFEPDAKACPRCHGGPCQGSDCMNLVSVEEVARAVRSLIRDGSKTKVFANA